VADAACPADVWAPFGTPCDDIDDNACTTPGCTGVEGEVCDQDQIVETCPDDPDCLVCDPLSDPNSDPCVLRDPIPPVCFIPPISDEEVICRTGGFYGTHAAVKTLRRGRVTLNITQDLLDALDPNSLMICGHELNSTTVGDPNSALEALCVSPEGLPELQLVRQLTTAGLNCILSGGSSDCSDISLGFLFEDCDAVCIKADTSEPNDPNAPSIEEIEECIFELDCFNNGGVLSVDGWLCEPALDSCHDRDLCPADDPNGNGLPPTELNGLTDPNGFCFEPPGPAGSGPECKAAIQNECTVLSCD
jgi:hypothetical protein